MFWISVEVTVFPILWYLTLSCQWNPGLTHSCKAWGICRRKAMWIGTDTERSWKLLPSNRMLWTGNPERETQWLFSQAQGLQHSATSLVALQRPYGTLASGPTSVCMRSCSWERVSVSLSSPNPECEAESHVGGQTQEAPLLGCSCWQ